MPLETLALLCANCADLSPDEVSGLPPASAPMPSVAVKCLPAALNVSVMVIRLRGDSTRRPGRPGLGSHEPALHLLSPRSPCDPPTSPAGGDVATGQDALISAHASSCFLMVEAHFLPRP